MTQTLNPVITVTVSGPVGSGKSYILARIEEVVKQEFGGSVIVDAADVDDERRMSGDDLTTWQKPRGGTVIRLEEYTGQGLLSYGEERICRTNELLDVICPTGRQPCHTARSVSVGRMSCWMLYAPRAGNPGYCPMHCMPPLRH